MADVEGLKREIGERIDAFVAEVIGDLSSKLVGAAETSIAAAEKTLAADAGLLRRAKAPKPRAGRQFKQGERVRYTLDAAEVLAHVKKAGKAGIRAEELRKTIFKGVSSGALLRRLKELASAKKIKVRGQKRAARYTVV